MVTGGFLSGFAETPAGRRGLFSNILAGQPKRVRDLFAPRFGEFLSEFQGQLISNPRLDFQDFLTGKGDLPGVNFLQRFGTFSPRQRRDFSASTLTPRTRFLPRF